MHFFNLHSCFARIHLLLTGVFYLPVVCLATDGLPGQENAAVVSSISVEQWSAPRSGEAVLAFSGLRMVMEEIIQQPDKNIMLHYPQGEHGKAWGEELRDWLVTLGLPSNRIQLMPGNAGDMIKVTQVVAIQHQGDWQNVMPQPVVESFPIQEATDITNGVEIP